MSKAVWHKYPKDRLKEEGEFNLDMLFPMVEWAEIPEPYKGGDNEQ